MCAIAGLIQLQTDGSIIEDMLKTMKRRGPDGEGEYIDPECCLLHTRLAIIDPEGGKQPMTLQWNRECYTIVYNGEIYNTEEIRKLLIQEGHVFSGHSDTEVVLHAYVQWGKECVQKLNGIFAFGVWEKNQKRLFLARDRIGVKPLFYAFHRGGLLFASEMKTILTYPTFSAILDEEGAAEIIMLGPGRTPGCGVFHGTNEIEPGYCGYFEKGKLTLTQYWKLQDRIHKESFEETREIVSALVRDAIKRQMVSDVPIGTFLSGGLDSSLITAICAAEYEKNGKSLSTYSVDYKNNDRYFKPGKFQPNSDPYYIRLIESQIKNDHRWTVLDPEDLVGALEDSTIARDLPGMADVDFSLLCFCREIRKTSKVALSGECADEIFGGYPWYRDPEVRELDGFPWAQNTLQRKNMLSPNVTRKLDAEAYVSDRYRETCMRSDILPENNPQERRMKEMVNLNFRWFMQTLLDRKDRMSMYSGLEVRVPFCDYRIAEYLYAVPWEYKDHDGKEKGLLRAAMEGVLPEEVLWRKKSPYPKTFDPRYEQLIGKRFESMLQEKDSPIFYLLKKEGMIAAAEASSPWPWYGQLMRKPQIMAYLLQINFWLKHYKISFAF